MSWSRLAIGAVVVALAGPLAAAGAQVAAQPQILPFIEDDAPKAQALARSKKLPLFVEAWAPW